jgi:signal transduction histidine kinase
VLREVEREWHGRLAALGRPLIIDAESLPLVQGPPAALRHAISILVDNAARHGRGAVRVGAEAGLEAVTISVSDDGPGFPEAFEPGRLTPDETGDGQHGVGLPLARRLVTSMPGRLVFVRLRPRPRIDIVVTAVHVPPPAERPASPAPPVVSPTAL